MSCPVLENQIQGSGLDHPRSILSQVPLLSFLLLSLFSFFVKSDIVLTIRLRQLEMPQ
jgi:hypothetical protein